MKNATPQKPSAEQLWASYQPGKSNEEKFWAKYEALLTHAIQSNLSITPVAPTGQTQPKNPATSIPAFPPPGEPRLAVFKPRSISYTPRLLASLSVPLGIALYVFFDTGIVFSKDLTLLSVAFMLVFGVLTPLLYASSAYIFSITHSGLYIKRLLFYSNEHYFAWRDLYSVDIIEEHPKGKEIRGKHRLDIVPVQGKKQSFVYHLSDDNHRDFVKAVRFRVIHFSCQSKHYYPVK
ncbi:hypothetical protein [Microscilla marina]|uniref:Uncharacterized protein n=1 Tax=Microscilla marina ATCC 23134 TaxID=313606 RepID=A1ZFB9_MICM2|nr:hypothetical protein [Microscilla marina]EAY30693.1 hypothetical protein M23134_01017 [Microscilla marina ATCC 23134]